jgi:hypothetical protein
MQESERKCDNHNDYEIAAAALLGAFKRVATGVGRGAAGSETVRAGKTDLIKCLPLVGSVGGHCKRVGEQWQCEDE